MATIDSAAAWRAKVSLPLVLAAAFASLTLAGCETTSNLLASATPTASNEIPQASVATEAVSQQKPLMAIAPVIGAPEQVADQFKTSLASALQSKGINAATSTAVATAYTLRGYIVSAREGTGTKVSYIWDVTTPSGQRVHRVTGEEVVAAAPASRDPWQAVSPQVISNIVGKTSSELAKWLPSQAAAQPAIAGTTPTPVASAAKAAPQAIASNASSALSGPTTGSIRTAAAPSGSGEAIALIPSVTGAPGDGSVSLANAIRKELERKGVRMASVPTPGAYRVQGRVKLGAKSGDTQPISIDWEVKDASGNSVGTVSQKNDIPAGSLDGAWGQTADAAAAAAAHGIAELIGPKKTASR